MHLLPPGRLTVAHDGRQLAFAVLAEALTSFKQMVRIKPRLDALREFNFARGVEQRRLTDPIEIYAH